MNPDRSRFRVRVARDLAFGGEGLHAATTLEDRPERGQIAIAANSPEGARGPDARLRRAAAQHGAVSSAPEAEALASERTDAGTGMESRQRAAEPLKLPEGRVGLRGPPRPCEADGERCATSTAR